MLPFGVQALSLDLLLTGEVAASSRGWAWTYLQYGNAATPPGAFGVAVQDARSTSGGPAPALAGTTAHLRPDSGFVAIVPQGGELEAIFERQVAGHAAQPATVLVGPYAAAGLLLTARGRAEDIAATSVVGMRDVTITRADGASDFVLQAPRAGVLLGHLQAVVV